MVIERHDVLRTSLLLNEGIPVQWVTPYADSNFNLPYEDLCGADAVEQVLKQQTDELALYTFDLFREELFKAKLLRVDENEYLLLFVAHSIIFDAKSREILCQELYYFYNALMANKSAVLPKPTMQYRDYVKWYEQLLNGDEIRIHQTYWLEKLGGQLTRLQIPTDMAGSEKQNSANETVQFEIPEELGKQITEYTDGNDINLLIFLTAALKTLLFRYSGQKDIVIGTPATGRVNPKFGDQIGCYTNLIPIRDQIDSSMSFSDLVQKVKSSILAGVKHQSYPLEMIIKSLDLPLNANKNSLFDVVIEVTEDVDFEELRGSSIDQVKELSPYRILSETRMDLLFKLIDHGDGISGTIQYNAGLFSAERMERMVQHFMNLQVALLNDPKLPVSEFTYLTAEEIKKEKQKVDMFSESIDSDF